MAKQKNKTRILVRYGFVTGAFILLAILIGISLIRTTIFEADEWNKEAMLQLGVQKQIEPERGSILASNGSILACNTLVYDILLDMRHPTMLSKKINLPGLDSLADYLNVHYPLKKDLLQLPKDSIEKYSWRTKFRAEYNKPEKKRNRGLILAKGVEKHVFDELRGGPFMSSISDSKLPMIISGRSVRTQPYGTMARYSIGIVNEVAVTDSSTKKTHTEKHGYSGLEKDLDSLLYGVPGLQRTITFNAGVGNWAVVPPVRGYDVLTTIDLNIQDILEQELLERCQDVGAEWGTALIMEVASGEIKAISNFERRDDGTYGEAYNRTVTCFEPGSVVKPVSLLIAFEDGLITNNRSTIDCSPFMQTTDPHAPRVKTIPEVMAWSSNTGVSRIIFRGYSADPAKFYDRWAQMKLFERMHTGIAEERPVRMKKLMPTTSDGLPITMTARHLDLARQAFGYSVEISPLYLLSIYNAIANDGVYVRPHLVRALRRDGRDSVIKHEPILPQLCTPEHARMLRECLRAVVTGGTAQYAKLDEVIEVAGKTGTCWPVFPKESPNKGYDKSKRRFAFAGFFPYQNPRYSCMVLVQSAAGSGSAPSISGKVLSRVAERMYARGMLGDVSNYNDNSNPSPPVFTNSDPKELAELRRTLGDRTAKRLAGPNPAAQPANLVPDVRNCDARTAVKQLETRGLNVVIRGKGRVISQSLNPGTAVRKGKKIILQLN